jgi:Fe-S-cluster-containing hydrogenase component 2
MIGCPTGAIHRNVSAGQVIINDETCIGCGACANSCPYNNIRLVDIRDDLGDFIVDQESYMPIERATKCDLCADQIGGPACQRACPNDALVRLNLRDLDRLAEWTNR